MNENADIYRIQRDDHEIILIGTAHISQASKELVRETIEAESPDTVCVELDEGRLKSIQDPEFVGVIAEALNAESWKRVVPAYYDISLKYKGARDEQSVAMLDLIVEGRIFDFGYVYGGTSPAFWIQNLLELNMYDVQLQYDY